MLDLINVTQELTTTIYEVESPISETEDERVKVFIPRGHCKCGGQHTMGISHYRSAIHRNWVKQKRDGESGPIYVFG